MGSNPRCHSQLNVVKPGQIKCKCNNKEFQCCQLQNISSHPYNFYLAHVWKMLNKTITLNSRRLCEKIYLNLFYFMTGNSATTWQFGTITHLSYWKFFKS